MRLATLVKKHPRTRGHLTPVLTPANASMPLHANGISKGNGNEHEQTLGGSFENLSTIFRQSLDNILRQSIDNRSNIFRRSFDDLSTIFRQSLATFGKPLICQQFVICSQYY